MDNAPVEAAVGVGDDRYARAERLAYRRDLPPLNSRLIDRFGGRGFLFNLRMWEARTRGGSSCSYVPANDYYRRRFEILASTGVAVGGKAVPLIWKYQALPMAAVREAARTLGAGKFRSKEEGARIVVGCQGAEDWLESRYDLNSFFLLQPEDWSYQGVEAQWRGYEEEVEAAACRSESADGDDDESPSGSSLGPSDDGPLDPMAEKFWMKFWSIVLIAAALLAAGGGIWLFLAIRRLLE